MDKQQQLALDYWFGQLRKQDYATGFVPDKGPLCTITCPLSGDVMNKLRQAANGQDISGFIIVMAAWMSLLHRYGWQQPVLFTAPVQYKNIVAPEHSNQKLYFFLSEHHAGLSFRELVNALAGQFKSAVQYQDYPFSLLEEQLAANGVDLLLEHCGLGILHERLHEISFEAAQTVLALAVSAEGPWKIYFRKGVLPEEVIQKMPQHLERILSSALETPGLPVTSLPFLLPEEKEALLALSGAGTMPAMPHELLHSWVESAVDGHAQQVAIVDGEIKLTFEALNAAVNRMANCLTEEAGIRPGNVVGLMVNQDRFAIITILAILKAGGVYLPLDTGYPLTRVHYMLKDANAVCLISDKPVAMADITVFDHDRLQLLAASYPEMYAAPAIAPEQFAYIIYTSGSTGQPKGVPVKHKQVCLLLSALQEVMQFCTGLQFILNASLAFDASVKEIFLPLVSGGTLHLYADYPDVNGFVHYLSAHKIEVLHASPLYWEEMLRIMEDQQLRPALRYISSGGDALTRSLAQKIRQRFPDASLMNLYGPTEVCINATGSKMDSVIAAPVTIGKALPGYGAFILDPYGGLLPKGISGELCITGPAIAEGYLNNEAATQKAFVEYDIDGRRRFYRTGDKVRWGPNGELEFLGRLDQQVKIRGYRIEPEEVRAVLNSHPGVEEAYVLAHKERNGEYTLVAYLRLKSTATAEQVKTYLSEQLPGFMLPGKWVTVTQFYRNTAGKIDVRRLPGPDAGWSSAAPESDTEAQLVRIWKEVLLLEHVGTGDNFFERGGHSLKAMRLLSAIIREWQVKVELKDIFRNPVLKKLAARIEQLSGKEPAVSISPAPAATHYPLSPAQKRLWIIHHIEEGKAPYNIPLGFHIGGLLDEERLLKALEMMMARYEILRTSFEVTAGEPCMVISPVGTVRPPVFKTYLPSAEELSRYSMEEAVAPFDLQQSPLWRLRLLYLSNGVVAGVLTFHHIIADGWSVNVFTRLLLQLYHDLSTPLPSLPLQYKDYAVWMASLMSSDHMAAAARYWQQQFASPVVRLELPSDYPRHGRRAGSGSGMYVELPQGLTELLQRFSRQGQCTPFGVLLAAFKVLLYKYTDQQDVVVGVPVAGREYPGLEEQIGFFVNTLAVRTILSGEESFSKLSGRMQEGLLEAYQYQDYPFDQLVDALKLDRDNTHAPLFDVMFSSFPAAGFPPADAAGGLSVSSFDIPVTTSKYDLLLNVLEEAGGYRIYAEYNNTLFSEARISRLLAHYLRLLEAALQAPERALDELDCLSEEEHHRLAYGINDQQRRFAGYPSLYHLFHEQALLRPDDTALLHSEGQMDHRTLLQQVKRLASVLSAHQVQAGMPVALCLERSVEMVVSILAVHAVGAYYIPLDPGYPAERIKYILRDTGARVVLSDAHTSIHLDYLQADPAITLVLSDAGISAEVPEADLSAASSGRIAYMIYTSGSTGEPKGVVVEHAQVLNTLLALQESYPVKAESVYLLKTAYVFDVSLSELFGWLAGGGKLAVLPAGDEKDPAAIRAAIGAYGVTHINFVPSLFALFLDVLKQGGAAVERLEYIFVAGEAFPEHLAQEVQACGWADRVYNLYGPTECSVYATAFAMKDYHGGPVPIGRPLPNVSAYVLDRRHHLVPWGVTGELCIGGAGVSNGYWGKPALTAEKFIDNPFGEGKLYCSGDLVRWTAAGELEFLGRRDEQVKINGYRVELGEITSVLSAAPGVKQAALAIKPGRDGQPALVAYVISDGIADRKQIYRQLSAQLPSYMVPGYLVQLEALPLNSSGKVNRQALPAPDGSQLAAEHTFSPPVSRLEKQLAAIWEEVLQVSQAGIHHNFFEQGGNSFAAIRLATAIRNQLQTELAVKDIFRYPTIAQLSEVLGDGSRPSSMPRLVPAETTGKIPLSPAQKRLWIIHHIEEGKAPYNIPLGFNIGGLLDEERLLKALEMMMARYEILRTSFEVTAGEPCMVISPVGTVRPPVFKTYLPSAEELSRYSMEEAVAPFDLQQSPLWRLRLLYLSNGVVAGVLTFHHIIADGWSVNVFTRLLLQLYHDLSTPLPSLPLQYKDYAVWMASLMSSDHMAAAARYWQQQFASPVVRLELPSDYPRHGRRAGSGSGMYVELPQGLTELLQRFSRQGQCTPFGVLLAAFKVLLYKYTDQQDVVVGVPVAGREYPGLEEQIGFFVNTLAVRTILSGEESFSKLSGRMQEGLLEAYQYQDYPFDQLVDALKLDRDNTHAPLFDVMFSSFPAAGFPPADAAGGLSVSSFDIPVTTSKYDLLLNVLEEAGGYRIYAEYNNTLFSEARISRLLAHYLRLLEAALQAPERALDELDCLSEEEHHRLAYGINDQQRRFAGYPSLYHLFHEQALLRPDDTALLHSEGQMDHRTLLQQVKRLASVLSAHQVQAGMPVALCLERSVEMVVSILAVHAVGAYYIPLDPGYPAERIKYILRDTGARVVLSDAHTSIHLDYLQADPAITLVLSDAGISAEVPEADLSAASSGRIAYMIYTSGSTGEPKGVVVEHAQVLNTLLALQESYPVKAESVYLLKTAYVFDVSLSELFGWLAGGGKLAVLPAGDEKDPAAIRAAIGAYGVTHINFVPSLFALFLDVLKQGGAAVERLEYIFVAGEAFPEHLAQEVQACGWADRVYNLYGPTECSVYATAFAMKDYHGGPVPIGRPLPNVSAYVLDRRHHLVPWGVTGELCIGGAGVSNGYWGKPALTAEKFIDNPFGEGKLYCSGDLVRWTAAGELEFLGRRDEQVKINGYRVELGEITSVLSAAPGVKQAALAIKPGRDGQPALVAYVISDGIADRKQIYRQLSAQLPSYMVPGYLVQLEALPLNSSGKVNRQALPAPDGSQLAAEHTFSPPVSRLEKQLAAIWEEVLQVSQAGIHHNFFEQGGNSFAAIRLATAIRNQLQTELAVKDIFRYPTIAQLSEVLGDGSRPSSMPRLVPAETTGKIPLSYSQERFWVLDKLGKSHSYHIPVALRLRGVLNIDALENALGVIIQRHTALRTVIREHQGVPWQFVQDTPEWHLPLIEDSACADHGHLSLLINQIIARPFDLATDIPLRLQLIRIDEHTHVLLLLFHHIAVDIWSIYLIAQELQVLYSAYLKQSVVALPELPVQYTDYAIWQRQCLQGDLLYAGVAYWTRQLAGVSPLQLPCDLIRPAIPGDEGRSIGISIDKDMVDGIKGLAARHNTTLFVTLLAAFKVLLYRYTSQEDICVGTPVANREQPEIASLIGCFINTIALRSEVRPEVPFSAFLRQLHDTVAAAYAHEDIRFEKVIESLPAPTDRSYNPVFNVMFELQDVPIDTTLSLEDILLEEVALDHGVSRFDLTFSVSTAGESGELLLKVEYNTALFLEDTIHRMIGHYKMLITAALQHDDIPLGRMGMLTPAESVQLLTAFRGTSETYPQHLTVLDLFREQVTQYPEATALVFNTETLTYRKLDERSSQLAHYLIAKGVKKEVRVAVLMDRAVDVIVSMLGVIKAGGAYVPIDPASPRERVQYMLQDADVRVVITDSDYTLPGGQHVISLKAAWPQIEKFSTALPVIKIDPAQLVYIIYTSGSTGMPKGVMLEHRNLLNITLGWRKNYQLDRIKPVLFSVANIAFDVFTGDWCRALTNGGKMIIADSRNFDIHVYCRVILEHQVNIIEATPAVIMNIVQQMMTAGVGSASLRTIVVGADVLATADYISLRSRYVPAARVMNSYGVTEAAIDSSCFEGDIQYGATVPIGRPLDNIYYYILDSMMQPVPIGVWGELYIGGAGVARGYINKDDLTAGRFLPDPFSSAEQRMYKTGDVARWLPDGNVAFGGRKDNQVKIRGFRIELQEIENALIQHPDIDNAVVVAASDTDNIHEKYLCAYYTPVKEETPPAISALRNFLMDKLPVYMVPQYFVSMETIPLTANGKVDRKALPSAKEAGQLNASQHEPPANELETALHELWQEVLKTSAFGVTDNFFEIGGNSLRAVNMLALMNERFLTDIRLTGFILSPTIREQGGIILSFYEEQKHLFEEALDKTADESESL